MNARKTLPGNKLLLSNRMALACCAVLALVAGCDPLPQDTAATGDIAPDSDLSAGPHPDLSESRCDPLAPPCQNDGQCVLSFLSGQGACYPRNGAARLQEGAACEVSATGDFCADGLQCVRIDNEQSGTCRRICERGVSSMCEVGSDCSIELPVDTRYGFCGPASDCDVLTQSPCNAEQACVSGRDTSSGEIVRTCIEAGDAGQDEECQLPGPGVAATSRCGRGLVCLQFADAKRCAAYCAVDMSNCDGGRACRTGMSLGLESGVGVCLF